jgi:RNA recognition motif-containing protein
LALNLQSTQVSPNDLARRLYIGNLYYDLKEEDIRGAFAPFGVIHSIDLSLEPGYTQIDEVADELDWCCSASRSKGFCFLEYEDVLAAESAVQVLNGTPLANRTMRVRVAVGSGVAEMLVNSELSVLAAGWPTASRQHEPERLAVDRAGGDQKVRSAGSDWAWY